MEEIDNITLIASYHAGELDPNDRLAFESRLAEDEQLQADFEAFNKIAAFLQMEADRRRMMDGLQRTGEKLRAEGFFDDLEGDMIAGEMEEGFIGLAEGRQKISNAGNRLEREGFFDRTREEALGNNRPGFQLSRFRLSRILAVAAAVAGLIVLGWWWSNRQPDQEVLVKEEPIDTLQEQENDDIPQMPQPDRRDQEIVETNPEVQKKQNRQLADIVREYEESASGDSGIRGGSSSTDTAVYARALSAFAEGRYDQALTLSRAAAGDTLRSNEWNYLIGHSAFRTKKYDLAADHFLKVGGSRKYSAQWFAVLSFAADLPASKARFDSLAAVIESNPTNINRERLKRLRTRVNN